MRPYRLPPKALKNSSALLQLKSPGAQHGQLLRAAVDALPRFSKFDRPLGKPAGGNLLRLVLPSRINYVAKEPRPQPTDVGIDGLRIKVCGCEEIR